MTVKFAATRNTYSGCKAVLKANEARFCGVSGTSEPGGVGTVSTTALKGTSLGGISHQIEIEPVEEEIFTHFNILKKGTAGVSEKECFFNNDVAVEVKGSVEGEANTTAHAHLTFTEANNGTALKANGANAKYLDTVGGVMKGTSTVVGAQTIEPPPPPALGRMTAVECKEVTAGTGKYNTSACATPQVVGNFETKSLALNSETSVTGKSTEAEPALRLTAGGSAMTVKCSASELLGAKVTNREPTTSDHTAEGTATANKYNGCSAVLKANEARSCLVEGSALGTITTNALKVTSTNVEHKVKVSPSAGGAFAKFTVLNKGKGGVECPFAADVPIEISGFIEGEVDTTNHGHLTFTEANNGTGIKANGATATYLDTVGGTVVSTGAVVGSETFT